MTKSFEDATAVINALNTFLGLRNFEDPANKTGFLFMWIYDILILIFNIANVLFFAVHYIVVLSNSVARLSYVVEILVFAWCYACTLILGWHHSKVNAEIFTGIPSRNGQTTMESREVIQDILALRRKIAKVDESLRNLGSKTNYRHLFQRVMAILTFFSVYVILFAVLYIKWLLHQKIELFSFIISVCVVYEVNITAIVIYDFVTYVYWLELRYKQTNELVKALFVDGHEIKTNVRKEYAIEPTRNHRRQTLNSVKVHMSEYCFQRTRVFPLNEDPSSEHESQAARKVHMLQTVRCLHMELDLIVKMVNEIFNAQLVLQTTLTMMFYTMTLYNIYNELASLSTDVVKTAGKIAAHLLQVFNKIGNIALACYSCEYATNEANRMTDIIHAFSAKESDTDLKDEILQFSLQLSLTRIGRSKSNLFQLSYTTIRTYTSCVITYLIILIQYRPSFELNESALIQNETKYGNPEFSFV